MCVTVCTCTSLPTVPVYPGTVPCSRVLKRSGSGKCVRGVGSDSFVWGAGAGSELSVWEAAGSEAYIWEAAGSEVYVWEAGSEVSGRLAVRCLGRWQ